MPKKIKWWLFAISLCLAIEGCAAPSGDLPRFHEVSPGKVARSAQPTAKGYALMRAQGIRTVVKLNTDLVEEERAWAKENDIMLVEIPLPGLTAPLPQVEARVQTTIRNPALQPVLFHCEQGQDRTGLVAALYRVEVQGWTPASAHKEWMDLGHSVFLKGMDNFFREQVCASSSSPCF